jgi:solute carrier family 35 (GDP-fucose transporter), member C1
LSTNTVASVAFIPIVLLSGQMSSAIRSDEIKDPYFWGCLLLTGVIGCAMAWISAMQINVTSPITHHISANAKAVAQTLIAVVFYRETKTLLWWVSILMVATGAVAYAVTRMREESQNKTPSEPIGKVAPPPGTVMDIGVVDNPSDESDPLQQRTDGRFLK